MKKILLSLSSGETQLVETPYPQKKPGELIIRTKRSLVSAGTERMLVDFGKSNFIDKVRSQPDKVKMVLNKVRTDGVLKTMETVRSKLDEPLPLGYCNVGEVLDTDVESFQTGDRVVSNGSHAEVVRVSKNLCCQIPESVTNEEASFTVLGAIALQGVRLAAPTLGEVVVVTGLGLIGLMTVQILKAQGCRVLGIDLDTKKCTLACQFGAEIVNLSKNEDPLTKAKLFSRGRGVDAVLITASSKSNEPVSQAASMCRKRGRIVLVGVAGLELARSDFYEKELSFQVSCSYGPGRYDKQYEEKGIDYPIAYVRWTQQRNFEAVLDLMAAGKINVDPLITHRYQIEDAHDAYEQLNNREALGILLEYSSKNTRELRKSTVTFGEKSISAFNPKEPVCAFIGAGNYAARVLIPAFRDNGAQLDTVVTSAGVTGTHHGKKNGFLKASTDYSETLANELINTVIIATRHNQHALQVCDAIKAGKHVFVEKPLAITSEDIDRIDKTYRESKGNCMLMVGFNRRFAPHVVKMKALLDAQSKPKSFIFTVNAGAVPADHWTQDIEVGGGRIIGECCHFVDLMRFLVGAAICRVQAQKIGAVASKDVLKDTVSITLSFEDGSFGTILYFSNGGATFPKERIEVFCGNAVLQLDNYRKLKGYGWPGFRKMNLLKQDKGQEACTKAFLDAIKNGVKSPISYDEIIEVFRKTLEIVALL